MAAIGKNSLTIFMYPWFAIGHLTPYLLAANKLADRGHRVVLIVPPKARPKLSPLNHHPALIELRPVSVPHVECLPLHAETTNDITHDEQHLLRQALSLTEPDIEAMLRDLQPDFVFYDLMQWLPGLVRRLQIKAVYFSVVSPAAGAFFFTGGTTRRSTEDFLNGPPGYPVPEIKMYKHMATFLEGFEAKIQMFLTAIHGSDALAYKTCRETEGAFCEFLQEKLKKPVLLTGPILAKPQEDSDLDKKWADWLGKFEPKSVIFCAFGTEAVLKKDQFQQLLLGFEMTGLPFLVALRPPHGADSIEEALPDGFAERSGERGIVHGGWVPQQQILKHPSVGCFVAHGGIGSMWEGLTSDCQLVVLPHAFEHYIHARLLSGFLRVAVEIEKGDEDGLFTMEGVCGAVMAAMAEESEIGKEVKANHDRLREFYVAAEQDDSYFDGFVEKLRTLLV